MNASSSLRPPVADLVFHLYDRPLHPELFDTLVSRSVRKDDYDLTVRITRTGHALSWQIPDRPSHRSDRRRRPGAARLSGQVQAPRPRRALHDD